jgi:uncharacterized protein YndB with AHSA1/START domain
MAKKVASDTWRTITTLLAMGWLLSGQSAGAAEPLVAEAIISAPLATVWQGFVSREGYASVGIAQADIDLTVGGLVRVPTKAEGNADGANTISEILSFEPEHMLSTRVRQPPSGFDARAFANTWTVVYFTPLGPEMTHVRVAGFGFNEGSAAELTKFFEQDQVAQMHRLEKHYWPLCALCKKEGS